MFRGTVRIRPRVAAMVAICAMLPVAGPAAAQNDPAERVSFPRALLPYVYSVKSHSRDHYSVQVETGFVGPAQAALAVQPLCGARGKKAVASSPAKVILDNVGEVVQASLSYQVRCR